MDENKLISESSPYDNFVGQKDQSVSLPTLDDFIDIESVDNNPDWKKHWTGMPEFIQEANAPYKLINVRFRNEADYLEFAKLIGQNLTEKTKSIWYPELDKSGNSLKRWIEEE